MAVADRETIELLVESPTVKHPGLEEAIRLLEQVDRLTGRKYQLRVDVTGDLSDLAALSKVADMYSALRKEAKATGAAAKAQSVDLAQVAEKMNALNLLATQLAAVEARLVRPVNQATAALESQTDIAKRKAIAMGQLARATGQVGTAEKRAAGAGGAGGAERSRAGELSSTRTGDGILTGRKFSVDTGVTRSERYTRQGTIVSVEESRIDQARKAMKDLMSSGREQEKLLNAQGAPAAELAKHYQTLADQVTGLGKKYRDISPVLGAEGVAQAMRARASETEAAAIRKTAAAQEMAYNRAEAMDRRRATMQARSMRERAEAARIIEDFDLRGFEPDANSKRTKHTPKGRVETSTFSREANGLKETATVMMQYDRAGNLVTASSQRAAKAISQTDAASRMARGGFIENTAQMAKWAASAGILYGSLSLVSRGISGFTDIERRSAVLQQVFRGTAAEAVMLRDQVLSLAAANGRSSVEAVDAATRFARLGLTRIEIAEATAVALKAANVAEIDTATAAEQLSAVYASYSLRVEDLNTVLNQLNTISNTYNVTNKDLLNGLARTAPIARQAGLGLTELLGIIGAGVGRTGRPGAEFGNAIKSIIVALSNPQLQAQLKEGFNLDVKGNAGEIKTFSEILRELFVRYQELNNAERQALVTRVAGKMQASRLTALIDGYVQSQVLAIRANNDLTSAERENALVRQALSAQIEGLITQYEALSTALAGSNTGSGFNTTLTTLVEFLRNLLALMTKASDIVAISIAVLGLLAVRVGMVAMKTAVASREQNFFTATCHSTSAALSTLYGSLKQVVMGYNAVGLAATKSAAAQSGAANVTRVVAYRRAAGKGGMGGFFKDVIGSTLIGAAAGSILPGLGTLAGGGGGALRGLAVGITRLAASIAIDIGTFKLFELAIRGVNSAFAANADAAEKANRALAGLDQQLEETKAKVEGFRLSGRLAGTLEKLVRSPRQDPAFVEEQLRIGAEAFTDNPQERERLAQLYREGRVLEVIGKLKEYGAQQTQKELLSRREAIDLSTRQAQQTRRALAIREARVTAAGGDPAQDDAVQTLRRTLAEIEGRRIGVQVELEVDDSQVREQADKVAELLKERIGTQLSMLGDVYGDLGTTRQQKANVNSAGIQAQQMLLQKVLSRNEGDSADRIREAKARADAEEARVRGSDRYQGAVARAQRSVTKAERILRSENEFAAGNAFAPKGGGEPVARAKVALDEARANLRRLETLDPSAAEGGDLFGGLAAARAEQEKITKASEEHLQLVRETVAAQQEQLEKDLRIAEAKRAIVQYQEAIARGQREAGLITVAAGGRNETDRLVRESALLAGPVARRDDVTGTPLSMAAAVSDLTRARTEGDVKGELQAIANIQAQAGRLEEIQLAQLQRKLALENEIVQAKQRQAEEVSRALLLGSRDEQLTAAAAERFSKQRGGRPFSSNEFLFLDQNTRQNISRTNPDLLPPEMQTELQQLSQEYALSRAALTGFNGALGDVVQSILKYAEGLTPSGAAQDEINRSAADALNGLDVNALQQGVRDAGAGQAQAITDLHEAYMGGLERVTTSVRTAIGDVQVRVGRLEMARLGVGMAQGAATQ